MTIEELEDKHAELIDIGLGNTEEELAEYCFTKSQEHTKHSIQFTIEVLENINFKMSFPNQVIIDKIQELKQYLDETNKD